MVVNDGYVGDWNRHSENDDNCYYDDEEMIYNRSPGPVSPINIVIMES